MDLKTLAPRIAYESRSNASPSPPRVGSRRASTIQMTVFAMALVNSRSVATRTKLSSPTNR